MARTKASVGAKISTGKSSKARCCVVPAASAGGSGSSTSASRASTSGGNPVCHRETPKWQKSITTFFIGKEPERSEDDGAGTSSEPQKENQTQRKSKKNIIESDDETEEVDPNDAASKEINEKTKNDVENKSDNSLNDDQNNDDSPKDVENRNDAATECNKDVVTKEIAKNQELDESINLEPLDGEKSHKIEEYYNSSSKGKGLGKKSKTNKENLDSNRRDSLKRDLADIESDDNDEIIPDSKKPKVKS